MTTTNSKHVIFVYGTLRKGYGNYEAFLKPKVGKPAVTVDDNFLMTATGIPFVARLSDDSECIDRGTSIVGEVYEVSDKELGRIDRLEGHPHYYKREPIPVKLTGTNEVTSASIYLVSETSAAGGLNGLFREVIPNGDYTTNRRKGLFGRDGRGVVTA